MLHCRDNGINILAGNMYTFKVTPTVHTATENFRMISLEKRKCRFIDELPEANTTSMFTYYTQKTCMFECILKSVVNKVGCLPWDYPPPSGVENDIPMCTSYIDGSEHNNSRIQFEMAMNDADVNMECSSNCLPDCEHVSLKWQVDTTNLRVSNLCKDPVTRKVFSHRTSEFIASILCALDGYGCLVKHW